MDDVEVKSPPEPIASLDWSIAVALGAALGAGLVILLQRETITADQVAAVTGVFAAVATFWAVWVALMPLRLAEHRRLAAAKAVRLTTRHLLYSLAFHLEIRRLWKWMPRPIFGSPLVQHAIQRLWEVLPRTELLEVNEQAAISRAMHAWGWQSHLEQEGTLPIADQYLEQVLSQVIEAHDCLSVTLGQPRFAELPTVGEAATYVSNIVKPAAI